VGVVSLIVSSQFSIAEDWWMPTITSQPPSAISDHGTGWAKSARSYSSGSCYTTAYASYVDSDHHSTQTSCFSGSWRRIRYDWVGGGKPSPVTKNVSLHVIPYGQCNVDAKWWGYKNSNVSAYIYATGYATKSGGTPNESKSGHAKINLSAHYGTIWANWSLAVSKAGPELTLSQSGGDSNKSHQDSGNAQVGGSLTFNVSGAQIHTMNSAYASATQSNGSYGYAYSRSEVNAFSFK